MSLLGSIIGRIVHYAEGSAQPAPAPSPVSSPGGPAPSGMPAGSASAPPAPTPAAASLQSVDIGAVLAARAPAQGGELHWQTSIVDLLKVLDLDSSLSARKQLAEELGVHAGPDGSAEENVALHQAVVAKLAENGGNIPADMMGAR